MLDTIIKALQHMIAASQANLWFVCGFVGLFIIIHIINWILHYRLNVCGILPRTSRGFPGVFLSVFLHQDFNHLFFNMVPMFILSSLVLFTGRDNFYIVTIAIIFFSGLAVWIFGHKAIHIGASGLLMGYFGYVLTNAYLDWNVTAVILAILSFYYFGGLLFLLIPSGEKGVSWAAHFWGFMTGVMVAYFYPAVMKFITEASVIITTH